MNRPSTDAMSRPDDYFLDEAAGHADRLAAILNDSEPDRPFTAVPELLRSSHGLLNCVRLGGSDPVAPLTDLLESAARALAADDLVWGEKTRRAFMDTLDAIRARISGVTQPDDAEESVAIVTIWSELGVGPGQVAEPAGEMQTSDVHVAAPGLDDLPREVVTYFRSQARAVLDRARRVLDVAKDDDETARDLLPIMTELQDLASTFSFIAVEELAERTITALVDGEMVRAAELVDILHRTVFEPAGNDESDIGEDVVTDGVGGRESGPETADSSVAEPVSDGSAELHEVASDVALAAIPESAEPAVPIQAFIYRGDAALRRALKLEAVVRGAMRADPDARGAAEEVFDLIRIALTDEARAAEP